MFTPVPLKRAILSHALFPTRTYPFQVPTPFPRHRPPYLLEGGLLSIPYGKLSEDPKGALGLADAVRSRGVSPPTVTGLPFRRIGKNVL